MRTKKRVFYILLIMSLISIVFLFFFYKNHFIYNISLGIISGNIVAIVLTIIEYNEERKKTLDSFIVEINRISSFIANEINVIDFVSPFQRVLLESNDTVEYDDVLEKEITNFMKLPSSYKSVLKSMNSVILVSEISTIGLGNLFSSYHGLFSNRYKQDKVRKQLFKAYREIEDLITILQEKAWHFKQQVDVENKNYGAMLIFILEIINYRYKIEKKENIRGDELIEVIEENKYETDLIINKITRILYPDNKMLDYKYYYRMKTMDFSEK